jgi:hypothetical protein
LYTAGAGAGYGGFGGSVAELVVRFAYKSYRPAWIGNCKLKISNNFQLAICNLWMVCGCAWFA